MSVPDRRDEPAAQTPPRRENEQVNHSLHGMAEGSVGIQGGVRRNGSQPTLPQPTVSILVVVFRDRAELAALLENLSPFRGPETELIVIDGGSQDGSVDLLQQQNDRIDYWLSQRDEGIYDAMNKGIAAASGQYILHINAGDRLLELPLAQLALLAQRQTDVVCCSVLEDDNHLYTPRNGWLMRIDNPWHHQGTFYRRGSHLGYDPSYRVFGDFDHNQRLQKAGKSIAFIDAVIATHRTDGASSQGSRSEVYRSVRANFGLFYLLPSIVRFRLIKLREALRRKAAT
jgi:glycosyltransferase involved in cell wall biosynthesis